MRTFTDRLDREWSFDIAVPEIKAVREALNINLFDAFANDYEVYTALIADPEKLVAVAYVLLRDQIKEKGLSEEDFGHGMAGDSLRDLADTFSEALVDFFPSARARDLARATLGKMRELVELRARTLVEVVTNLNAEDLLLAKPSDGSMSAAESLASGPADCVSPSLQ